VRRSEALATLGVLLFLAVVLATIKWARIDEMRGDTAIFLQSMQSIREHGAPASEVLANTQAFIRGGYFADDARQLATSALTPPKLPESLFKVHAYWILYPLALGTLIIPGLILIEAASAIGYIGVLGLAYVATRRRGVTIAGALLLCALIVASPAWAWGALFGQFFPDRFFVLCGLAFMLAIGREKRERSWQLALALLCVLINERAALVAGVFALAYAALYRHASDRLFKAAIGALLVVYAAIVVHAESNVYAGFFPSTLHGLRIEFFNPAFLHATLTYLAVCLPFLILAAFEWRSAAIAALLMLPNVFGSIGGAEKTGWDTHYHSYYFPALVWAAIQGYAVLFRTARVPRLGIYGGTALLAIFLCARYPSLTFFTNFPQQALAVAANPYLQHRFGDELAAHIPYGADVTMVEAGMPYLYAGRTLHLFPLGVDHAQYAVLDDLGNGEYGGVPNRYPKQARDADRLIAARMQRDGYDFAAAVRVPGLGLVIVKRERLLQPCDVRAASSAKTARRTSAHSKSTECRPGSVSRRALPYPASVRDPSAT